MGRKIFDMSKLEQAVASVVVVVVVVVAAVVCKQG